MKNYTPPMSGPMGRALGKGIRLGTVFAEARSPVCKPAGR